MEVLDNISKDKIAELASKYTLPVYIYSEKKIIEHAKNACNFPSAFGLTARYAMKACSNAAILKIIDKAGMHIDASSGYEVERALIAGIAPEKILLSAQETAHNLELIVNKGVSFNACSIKQIQEFAKFFPKQKLGLRFNPGLGSGGTNRTNVGGPASSFGIWYEQIEEAKKLISEYGLEVERIHTHIGSGTDPEIWSRVAGMSMSLLEHFPQAKILNLGGGYKVDRMNPEKSSNLTTIGETVIKVFKDFREKTGREIKLEIEPGTYIMALSGAILAKIDDIVSTKNNSLNEIGSEGYLFYKTNTGMTDILRPSLYGAEHPIAIVSKEDRPQEYVDAIVVGHCCESGDILTPSPGDPEGLSPRKLIRAEMGDYIIIGGAGAYCASMSSKNYNSFPESAEILLSENGEFYEIRKRQELSQIIENEVLPEYLR